MTVGELIVELRKYDPSWTVLTEGCDCINDTSGVEPWVRIDSTVLITREKGEV